MANRQKYKMLVSIDSQESYELLSDVLAALSAHRNTTKSVLAQRAMEGELLPRDRTVRSWLDLYREGGLTALGLMALFFRRAGDDVKRGVVRANCQPIVDLVIDYLVNWCPRKPYELPDGRWVKELISLYRTRWRRKEHDPDSYFELADMLERQDGMPDISRFTAPGDEEGFVYELLLAMDSVVAEWGDPARMRTYGAEPMRVAMSDGDELVVPDPGLYRVLNILDAPASAHASVLRVRDRGIADVPTFIVFSCRPCGAMGEEWFRRCAHAAATLCTEFAERTDDEGKLRVAEEYVSSPTLLMYTVGDDATGGLFSFDDGLAGPYVVRGR